MILLLVSDGTRDERCEVHDEKLSVYCWPCGECICHQCALWGGRHSGHTFKPLDEVYGHHASRIRHGVSALRRRLMDLISMVQDLERNVDTVRSAKDERVREMRAAVELMIERLDSQLKTKLLALMTQKNALTQHIDQLELLFQDVDRKLQLSSKADLIQKSREILATISAVEKKSVGYFLTAAATPVNADFVSEVVPK